MIGVSEAAVSVLLVAMFVMGMLTMKLMILGGRGKR